MERYSEYKDSGVQWIGDIPSHWGVVKLNYVFSHNTGKTLNANLKGTYLPYLTTSNVYNGYFDLSSVKQMPFLEEEVERYTIKDGDLLICEGGDVGRCNIWKENYTICYQNHLHRLRPKIDANVVFFYYLINHFKNLGVFDNYSKGIAIKGLSSGTLGNTKIVIPSLAEQERIVSYLEDKTSKIDAYVAEKEKEIQLLQELKQKTIADAVTKGLNPDVKMKDSGISWIGMIPEHWEVSRMKRIFSEAKEKTTTENGTLLSLSQYTGITLKDEAKKVGMFEAESTIGYNVVHPGQFVMNIMLAWNGSYAVSDYEGIISPSYCVFNFNEDCEKKYFHYLLRQPTYAGAFKTMSKGIIESRLRLYPTYFFTFKTIIPPLSEQRAIVAYIEEKCQKIGTLMTELQAEIDYMKEYKQRLIADCVTGQVNVSGV